MNTISSCLRWSALLGLMMFSALWTSGSTRVSAQETERSGLTVLVRTALDSNNQLVAAREAYNLASEQVSEAWGSEIQRK